MRPEQWRTGLARLLESQALEEVIGASVFGGDEPLIEERTRQMVIGGGENSARGAARYLGQMQDLPSEWPRLVLNQATASYGR